MGEHLPCKQGVRGSNPLISTYEAGALRDCKEESSLLKFFARLSYKKAARSSYFKGS